MQKPRKVFLRFGKIDKFGNGSGVRIELSNDLTPKQIVSMAKSCEKVGWLPTRKTKQRVDEAKETLKNERMSHLRK